MNIIISESQLRILKENYNQEQADVIIPYIKSFGQKGKLPSFEGSLYSCYQNSIPKAYEWASESTDGVSHDGLQYFASQFKVQVAGNFIRNKRGLIYVERSIDLDLSKGLDGLNFQSLGECWSWKRLNARSYCSDNYLSVVPNKSIVTVVLCGYVHPQSVDWVETIYLNSYKMKNETEIRMNDNAQVEVAYIKIGGQKYPLGGSVLVNASADKYTPKNW